MKNSFLMLIAMVIIGTMWTNGAFAQSWMWNTAKSDAAKQADSGSKAGERKVLTIKGVEYAFRWCPAGTFTMGSPEDEPYRNHRNETQHRVTLTKGFWMLEAERLGTL